MSKKIAKTFKIGEYAKGGVITVEIQGNSIAVIGKDWDFSTGSKKSSDQSNAQEFTREVISTEDSEAYYKLSEFLNDLTTSFYTDEIIKWIKSKVTIGGIMSW